MTIKAKNIRKTVQEVSDKLEKNNVDIPIIMDIELALEELLTNILHHGYDNQDIQMDDEIQIELNIHPHLVEIRVMDRGMFYDINTHQIIHPVEHFNNNVEGGFGANLIKKIMNEVICERKNDANYTTLRKII